jgi:glycosyltransferase involved in cell wall biosynthesis
LNDPLVSVVITTYNLGWCIEETLQSVLNQTYRNLEIIVVDDASTDDTQERVAPFKDRIKYIRHASNQGLLRNAEGGPARNSGVRAAAGDYIAMLDGDDLWEPDKIAVQVEVARQFPHAGLVVTNGVSFNHEDGQIVRRTLLLDSNDLFFSTLPDDATVVADLYYQLLHGCVIDTPSQVMIARRVFETVGLFSECRCDDYEFYVRASAAFDIAVVNVPLVRYRQHHANLSGSSDAQFFRFVQPNVDIWRRHLLSCRPEARGIIHRQIHRALATAAQRAGRHSDRTWATEYLKVLLRANLRSRAAPYIAYKLLWLQRPRGLKSAVRSLIGRAGLQLPALLLVVDLVSM